VLIKTGTLLKGDFVIAGSSFGRIKIMFDENSKEVKEAEPSKPVKIVGLNKTPDAGQTFIVSTDENQIKEMAKKIDLHESFTHAYDLANNVVAEGTKKINIILKTDVHGTLEAIKSMLSKIEVEGTKLTIIRSAVGGISETDVNLAKSSNSVIIGFNIKPSRALKDVADSFGVKILFYNIIYKLQEDMVAILKGQLEPTMVEKETGEARILQL
jgi:translation initiation factor IF-2